jgi:hypothetical protein
VNDKPLTDADLSELQRLLDLMPPPPWDGSTLDDVYDGKGSLLLSVPPHGASVSVAPFAASARNLMPRLLAELRRLRAVSGQARPEVEA